MCISQRRYLAKEYGWLYVGQVREHIIMADSGCDAGIARLLFTTFYRVFVQYNRTHAGVHGDHHKWRHIIPSGLGIWELEPELELGFSGREQHYLA